MNVLFINRFRCLIFSSIKTFFFQCALWCVNVLNSRFFAGVSLTSNISNNNRKIKLNTWFPWMLFKNGKNSKLLMEKNFGIEVELVYFFYGIIWKISFAYFSVCNQHSNEVKYNCMCQSNHFLFWLVSFSVWNSTQYIYDNWHYTL